MTKYETIIYKSIENRAKEMLEETGNNKECFNFITNKMIELLATTFNGTIFMRVLNDLRSNYEEGK